MEKLKLQKPEPWEWVPLKTPNPNHLRSLDPETVSSHRVISAIEDHVEKTAATGEHRLLADRYFSDLENVLSSWIEKGRINPAHYEKIYASALDGAMLGLAERNSDPLREHHTHPRWHGILTVFEDRSWVDAGPTGTLAFNAAHRGTRLNTTWVKGIS